MHVQFVRSFVLLLPCLLHLSSAYALPVTTNDSIDILDECSSGCPQIRRSVERREPAKFKLPKPQSKPKPTSAGKPAETKTPPASIRTSTNEIAQSASKGTPKSTAKPTPSPASTRTSTDAIAKSTSKGTPKSTTKPTPSPTPSKSTSLIWPKIPVPYPTTAFDTCDTFVPCGEDVDILAARDANRVALEVITVAPITSHLPYEHQEKRDIRTFKVKLTNKVLTIRNLDYPSSPDLFDYKEVKRNVFDFASNRMEDTNVKNIKRKPSNSEMPNFVTEHIVELQTIGMFMKYAIKAHPQLNAFFETHWLQQLNANQVTARKFKPSYYKPGMTTRTSISHLVFEALGSYNNLEDFVMCESQINTFKMRMWKGDKVMADSTYNRAAKGSIVGANPSNEYISALRATIAVYRYMQRPEVKRRMEQTIANVEIELKNIPQLTGQNVNIGNLWRNFMSDHMKTISKETKDWLEQRINKNTKPEIQRGLVKYRKMLADLKKKEGGPQAQAHHKKQASEKTRLDRLYDTKNTEVTAQEQKIKDTKKDIADKTSGIGKAHGAAKTQLEKERDDLHNRKNREQLDLKRKVAARGRVSRSREELYSNSVEQIVINLERDQKVVTQLYEQSLRISMPKF